MSTVVAEAIKVLLIRRCLGTRGIYCSVTYNSIVRDLVNGYLSRRDEYFIRGAWIRVLNELMSSGLIIEKKKGKIVLKRDEFLSKYGYLLSLALGAPTGSCCTGVGVGYDVNDGSEWDVGAG